MKSITTTNTLHVIFNFLNRNNITFGKIINYGI
jgi:hypothetical protein